MRKVLNPLLVLLTFASMFLFAYASADGPSEGERKNLARVLYTEGIKLQEQGKYADALLKLEAAQKQYQAPTHLLHIAECQAVLGRLVDASENYRQLARMSLPEGAPDAFKTAQQQGAGELQTLEPRIPQLKIEIKDPPQANLKNLQIVLGEKPFPVELVGISRPIDPGKYTLQASADGYVLKEPKEIVITEREKRSVALVFQAGQAPPVVIVPPPGGSAAAASASAAPTSTAPPPPEQPKEKKSVGILIGGRLEGVLLRGAAADYIGPGVGVGIDAGFKFSRAIYLGMNVELGREDSGRINSPNTSNAVINAANEKYGASMLRVGASFGFFTSHDKLAFWGDFSTGYRQFNITYGGDVKREFTYVGWDLIGVGLGAWIPAGPLRLIPRVGYDLGVHGSGGPEIDANGCGRLGSLAAAAGGSPCTPANLKGSTYGHLGIGLLGFFTTDLI